MSGSRNINRYESTHANITIRAIVKAKAIMICQIEHEPNGVHMLRGQADALPKRPLLLWEATTAGGPTVVV